MGGEGGSGYGFTEGRSGVYVLMLTCMFVENCL